MVGEDFGRANARPISGSMKKGFFGRMPKWLRWTAALAIGGGLIGALVAA